MEQHSDNRKNNLELLAPAGDFDGLKCAVAGGADAVYLGLQEFNARGKAKNFSREEFRTAVLFCHERGVRAYLTLNTLLKDREFNDALDAAKYAYNCGIDAVLVQDLALLVRLKTELPKLALHASTQMGVHNLEGAKYATALGVDRVVLSRECLPGDIKKICEAGIDVEFFVHGAMCVAFSGNCYFSSVISGYSGNRGKCMQLCRKKYTLGYKGQKRVGYMLSPKDVCLYKSIEKMRGLGIRSYKIEGRLRSSEYAYITSKVYSGALRGKKKCTDIDELKTVFNRGGYTQLYLEGDYPDIIYAKQQNNIGLEIGKVLSVRPLKINGNYDLAKGDGLKFLRDGSEVGGGSVANNKVVTEGNIRVGDTACITKSKNLINSAKNAVRAIEQTKCDTIQQFTAKITTTMSDIIVVSYNFESNSIFIRADEHTDKALFKHATHIIYSPLVYSLESAIDFCNNIDVPVILELPNIARGADMDLLRGIVELDIFAGYVANNIYGLELCKNKKIIFGSGMNFLSSVIKGSKIVSLESAIFNGDIVFAYGRYALMTLSHCPRKQLDQACDKCNDSDTFFIDECGNKFALRRRKMHYCYFEVLNSKTTNLLNKMRVADGKSILVDCASIDDEQAELALKKHYGFEFDPDVDTVGRFGKGVK